MTSPNRRRKYGGNCYLKKISDIYSIAFVLCALLITFSTPAQSAISGKLQIAKGAWQQKNHIETHQPTHNNQILDSKSSTWTISNGTEKWKRSEIRFLTKIKWESDGGEEDASNTGIAASNFHIIELEPEGLDESEVYYDDRTKPRAPETLRIHLMQKSSVLHPDFRVVVRDGDSEETWNSSNENESNNCHFVGQVTTSAESHTNGSVAGGVKGLALLSACPPSQGFSGLILMEDGRQWYIEPVSEGTSPTEEERSRSKREAHSHYESIEHVLLPHSELAGQLASHISDVLRVPLPQLEEAARLAALDAEARRNMNQDWDDSGESLQVESSILTPFFHSGATLPFHGRGGSKPGSGKVQSKVALARKAAAATSPSKKPSAATLLSPRDTVETPVIINSQEKSPFHQESRVVEIAVFTDEELFTKMKSKFTVDTTAQLKEYATAMVNMMDVMYQHDTLGVDLRFRLVYLEVMKRRPGNLKTNGGKAKAYLSSFCDYAGEKNANSAQWDHALLLTGVDLHEEGVKTTAGLAWAGTMCYRYYSCSISEGLNFASAYITTHEIGHSLGMEHDGVGISETCDSTKYIMSPTTGPGKVTWSACSAGNLQDFIKYGTSELRGKQSNARMLSRPICLEELVARTKKSVDGSTESDLKLPGEKYDANYQCSLGMGTFFKPHFERNKPPFDNICWILYCGNGTHAISTHPALEGTPCDRKKYCRAGQCVKKPES